MKFIVRKAKKEDIPDIMKITREAFTEYCKLAGIDNIPALNETYEDVEKDLETKDVFIAFIDDTPVGSIRVSIDQENKTAYISRFGVRLNYQNNGIGKALIKVVDSRMKELGIKKVYLHTASKIAALMRFYYGRGFYVDSTTKDRGYIRALLCKEYE